MGFYRRPLVGVTAAEAAEAAEIALPGHVGGATTIC